MKVFISWSGDTSRKVAEVLREWLPSVIQAIHPYVSSEDIDKGARWSADISQELEESNYGILCVTRENLAAPWLNFEAGALSKSFDKSRVSPFLFIIDRSEVTGPLLQFQSTIYERDDVLKLVRSINSSCDSGLDEARVDAIFDVWWPSLERELNALAGSSALGDETAGNEKRSAEDVMNEILALVRSQQKILSDQADLVPYLEHLMRRREGQYLPPMNALADLHMSLSGLRSELAKLADTSDETPPQTLRLLSLASDAHRALDLILHSADISRSRAVNRRLARQVREGDPMNT